MKFLTYGSAAAPAVLLIHGMGCGGEHSFQAVIPALADTYRVIVPLLDGYDGGETIFSTIQNQAEKIARYLEAQGSTHLYAAVGMSMGGFICLELFCRFDVRTDKLILDSGYLNNLPCSRLVSTVTAWGFGALRRGKWKRVVDAGMGKIMGYRFRAEDLYPASFGTIYQSELSCITYPLPEDLEAIRAGEVEFWYGEKEPHMIAGMETLKKRLPGMKCVSMGDVGHGEIMFEDPERYAENIVRTISTSQQ